MNTFDLSKINSGLYSQINNQLGPIAPLYWTLFGSYIAQGMPAQQSVEKTFEAIQTTLSSDVQQLYERHLPGVKRAA